MSDNHTPPTTARSVEEKYFVFRSDVARDVARSGRGTDLHYVYTTREQADRFGEHLGIGVGDVLLDLGAGRAWPGSHIAHATGCDLVTTDLPIEALLSARDALNGKLESSTEVVCADGRRLPFGDSVFDAVCHADVLC